MSKFRGVGATINKAPDGSINTNGKACVINHWDSFLGKYKVDFGNGFCGWYKRSELIIDITP